MPEIEITRAAAPAPPLMSAQASVAPTPPMALPGVREGSFDVVLKRVMDVAIALAALVLLWPVLLIIAIAVKVDSPGPVVFRQRRLGKDGAPFMFLKFRTMIDGNDPAIHRSYVTRLMRACSDELKGENGSFKIECDPRVTRVGRILRRTSLDELPQLWNVLRGEMAIVGPRPPVEYEAELYTDREMRRLEVLPGLTGLWQVSGRCETTFDEMIDLDLQYVDTWSLRLGSQDHRPHIRSGARPERGLVMKDGLLTVAIVGYGYWGPNLLRNYMELPHAKVKWVCDRDPMKLAKAKTRYPSVLVTESYGDVLARPRCRRRRHRHADLDALRARRRGVSARQARLRREAADVEFAWMPSGSSDTPRVADVTLMVGHTFEFSPPVVKIKEIIDSGELGDVYFVSSSRVNLGLHQKDVSVIWDLAPHDFSILFDWLGEEPEHVSAMGRGCVKCDIPDVAFVNLRFPSGAVAEVQLSWLSPVKLRRTIVVGSKKMLVYDDTETVEKVKLYDHGVTTWSSPGSFGEFQLSYRTGDIVSPHLDTYEPLFTEASHFVDCVLHGSTSRRPTVAAGFESCARSSARRRR